MKKYDSLLFLFFIFFFSSINAQEKKYPYSSIPDSLKQDAYAVIRKSSIDIVVKSLNHQTVKTTRVVTILNELGDGVAGLYQHYSNSIKIDKLSVKIYDAVGNELKKYSKNQFLDVSAVRGGTLYSDARIKYINYIPTVYPYTIVFESKVKRSSTGYIPNWNPIASYNLGVEESTYSLSIPKENKFRSKDFNFKRFNVKRTATKTTLNYKLEHQKAIRFEKSSVSSKTFFPSSLVALDNIETDGVSGYFNDWDSFGKWMSKSILNNRRKLPLTTIKKIKELTKDAKTDEEKARIVYKFVQDKTRYVSVQIGIGGYQPIKAEDVDKMGYGDCKGLTNYTKALLEAVDVTSYYAHVYAGETKRSFDEDFATLEQGNHAILNLPNNGNDIWLECTSQTMPFGFLGEFTDDRKVLVIRPEGGIIKKTPSYKNEYNHQITSASISLKENGNLSASLERVSRGTQYNDKFYFKQKTKEDLKEYYKSSVWGYNNNLKVNSISLKDDKNDITFTEKATITIDGYARIIDNNYLFRLNTFNKFSYIPKKYRNRRLPLKVDRGFLDEDEYKIIIPEGYSIGVLPTTKELKNKFGIYKISVQKINETTLLYKKYFLIKEGVYPKEDYNNYRKFLRKVAKLENIKIELTQKN